MIKDYFSGQVGRLNKFLEVVVTAAVKKVKHLLTLGVFGLKLIL